MIILPVWTKENDRFGIDFLKSVNINYFRYCNNPFKTEFSEAGNEPGNEIQVV